MRVLCIHFSTEEANKGVKKTVFLPLLCSGMNTQGKTEGGHTLTTCVTSNALSIELNWVKRGF